MIAKKNIYENAVLPGESRSLRPQGQQTTTNDPKKMDEQRGACVASSRFGCCIVRGLQAEELWQPGIVTNKTESDFGV